MDIKKTLVKTAAVACLAAGALAAQPAFAQHWHGGSARFGGYHGGYGGYHGGYYGPGFRGGFGVGVFVGPGYWGPGWGGWGYGPWYGYDYPGVYYPPVAIATQPYDPVYVEQGDVGASGAASNNNYWYHCDNPSGYYPYVKECPAGWQRVSPQPPAPSR